MLKLSRCLTYEKFKWTSVKMRCIKEEDNVVKKEFQKKIHNKNTQHCIYTSQFTTSCFYTSIMDTSVPKVAIVNCEHISPNLLTYVNKDSWKSCGYMIYNVKGVC